MKRCFVILFIVLLITGCSRNTTQNSSANSASSQTKNDLPTASTSETLLSEIAQYPSIYKSYMQKCSDLTDKYGYAGITNNSDYSNTSGNSYLTGLCVVDLIDFNGDGVKDLLVIYSNGTLTGKNSNEILIPQSKSYEIEIWTDINGELEQLLHESFVGDFLSFDNTYWDTDNCMVTVFENKAKMPVIQLFNNGQNSLSYTDLYYSGEKVVKDKLDYSAKKFKLNGLNITETVWNEKVGTYNKILLSALLSSDNYSISELKNDGIDYNDTLSQTDKVLDALGNSKSANFKVVEANYFSLYFQQLDKINRSIKDLENYNYSIYDIDKNGTPELIVNNYYTFDIYTIVTGKIVHCGNFPFKDCSFYYNGKSGLISYGGHMGYYHVDKITLNNKTIKVKTIKDGQTNGEYPKLSDFGLDSYKSLVELYTDTPYLLYMYNDKI